MNLDEIDYLFKNQLIEINKIVASSEFEVRFMFRLDDKIDYNILSDLRYSGVYLIEIKTDSNKEFNKWIEGFRAEWEKPEYIKSFVPNLKLRRLREHKQLLEWIPLYLGKSKNISKRIKEHIDLKLTQPTTALKLLERKNIYGNIFRVSTIKLDVHNYDLIVPQFEQGMRNRINPILGRQ